MSRSSEQLKVRAVRLALLAAFVFTFMWLPTVGHTLNVDLFKSFDIFQLEEGLLSN